MEEDYTIIKRSMQLEQQEILLQLVQITLSFSVLNISTLYSVPVQNGDKRFMFAGVYGPSTPVSRDSFFQELVDIKPVNGNTMGHVWGFQCCFSGGREKYPVQIKKRMQVGSKNRSVSSRKHTRLYLARDRRRKQRVLRSTSSCFQMSVNNAEREREMQ